jgi:glutamate/tyrosine decarboxylase-like PLP-dependent enzyme
MNHAPTIPEVQRDNPYANIRELLQTACDTATAFLEGLKDRPVGRPVDYSALLAKLGGQLPLEGEDDFQVIRRLAENADPGLVATPGPRYYGFVTGGSLPAAVAADWLATAWDQNGFSYALSPAAAVAEEVCRQWLLELLGLPEEMSLGFVTGATMANFTGLASARHALLKSAGWNVEEQGLPGAPPTTVVTSEESHISIFASLQMLGLGRERVIRIPTDEQGRMRADKLRSSLATVNRPVLVCAQAGNVNTGAFDPLPEIAALVHEHHGWLHVDGAFGAWAAASSSLRNLTGGIHLADSIAVDGHKWLNVPYDCGLAFVRDREAHHAAMTLNAPYYGPEATVARENHNWVPEASRRARGFPVYAALRSLGRNGIGEMVDRCCRLARRMAEHLAKDSCVGILNEVVLNQVLVRFSPPSGGDTDTFTAEIIGRIQREGTCWAGGTSWHGMHAMRISVSNWSTTEADIDISAEAILGCAHAAGK